MADLGDFAFHTPSKEYADLKQLNDLPKVHLENEHYFEQKGTVQKVRVQLKNKSDHLAFLINLKIMDKATGELILPILWEDNFLNLLPGEERIISATYTFRGEAQLKIEGWNQI
ncbi:MAG TPA: hypothetical protein VLZ54_13335 [Arenibacter sp.]|nr:hypothetical protein [Arenibacter sp.]